MKVDMLLQEAFVYIKKCVVSDIRFCLDNANMRSLITPPFLLLTGWLVSRTFWRFFYCFNFLKEVVMSCGSNCSV